MGWPLALLLLVLAPCSTASRRGLAAVPAGAQVRNEDRFFYTTLNGITLANTTVVANPLPSAPLESPAESPAALLIASELGFTGQWDTFSLDSGVVGIHTVLTSDNYVLLMERPGNREAPPNIAAVYNLNTNSYVYLPMTDSPFCSGHLQLLDDRILVVGGDNIGLTPNFTDGRFLVRVVDSGALPSYSIVATMQPFYPPDVDPNSGARWYPSLMTMPDGNVLIVGGQTTEGGLHGDNTSVNPTFQFFNPRGDILTPNQFLPALLISNPINLYPFLGLLSDGTIMMTAYNSTYLYSYIAPYGLVNSTAVPVPDLPHPTCYPYTASPVLLPIAGPDYINAVLMVGGTVDFALATTPSASTSQLLDFAVQPLAWVEEQMAAARVMPDAVLLPDGTVLIVNGGNTGLAGGAPGAGSAANTGSFGARAAEMYDPSRLVGQRYSGLLANSGLDRLYHSNAFLTINGDVLVTGSESTENYIMQTFLPPYLVGNPNRPQIALLESTAWAWGEAYNVSVTWSLTPAAVDRAVLYRCGGVTHSVHWDMRQVVLEMEDVDAGLVIVQAPPNAFVGPPGLYMLFLLSEGVPSVAAWVGLGGAIPQQTVVPIEMAAPVQTTTPLTNGVYTIVSYPRSLTPGCRAFLSVPLCDNTTIYASNAASLVDTDSGTGAEHWIFTLLPNGAYQIQNQQRKNTSCTTSMFSLQPCYSPTVNVVGIDDGSGRQEWTVVHMSPPVQGVLDPRYYISASAGRSCGQDYLAAMQACPFPATVLPTAADWLNVSGPAITPDLLQVWEVQRVADPDLRQPLPANGTYSVVPRTRSLCASFLEAAGACPSLDVVLGDIDTGSGAQRWIIDYVPGSDALYTIQVACTHAACGALLSAHGGCADNNLTLATQDWGTGQQHWQISAVARGPATAYTIMSARGGGCTINYLAVDGCLTGSNNPYLAGGDDGTGNQQFELQPTAYGCPLVK